ncbi:MAG TPA: selenide, water dikinase SelD, partial [Ilumatobacteraceae bacterium]|nr:selenide, water dikinase SelD [Ilumatobacteraceae bacterium]
MSVATLDTLRLTEWTSCGGCAAKWGAALLQDLVADFPVPTDPSLLIGLAPFDDAAIYKVSDDVALVSTTD